MPLPVLGWPGGQQQPGEQSTGPAPLDMAPQHTTGVLWAVGSAAMQGPSYLSLAC
jgi:hypothetical protein